MLSASFLRNLTDERGTSFFPAALICFVFSFIVSIAVSSLNQVIPFVAMAKHFTGPTHDFGWVLLLLLLIGIIVFFAVGWFGEMILQLSRFIGIGLALGSIPGILSGTNDTSFSYGDPLFWVFFIILIIYWIVRKMQIEPLEDVIEYASDDFIQNRGRSSIWVPFVY